MADAVQGPKVPTELRDGYEVHAAALRAGLQVALYPRQVLITREVGSGREASFVHGIPETAQLGPVTYAQDKRMRRALMESADLPIPRGVTFSVGRGVQGAKDFARKVGYPVVVKPAVGDNAIEVFAGICDDHELDAAIERLRVTPSERETFTRAAYGLTELREPGEEDGRIVVPPGYRFLVEQHLRGTYLRVLVVGDTAHSAVVCPGSPGLEPVRDAREVSDDVHPTIFDLAVRALRSIPGLPLAAVDFVLDDYRRPAHDQNISIVEFSERPGLAVQATVSSQASARLGERILLEHLDSAGITAELIGDVVSVRWSAHALPDPARAEEAVRIFCKASAVAAGPGETDAVEGALHLDLHGPAHQIARLTELLLDGKLDGHRAMFVGAQPIAPRSIKAASSIQPSS